MSKRLAMVGLVAAALLGTAPAAPSAALPLPGAAPSDGASPVLRPRAMYFGAGGGFFIRSITWTRLSPTTGTAVGTVHVNDCTPYCARGTLHTQRATLVFSDVTRANHPYFNCLRLTYQGNGWITRTSHVRTTVVAITDDAHCGRTA